MATYLSKDQIKLNTVIFTETETPQEVLKGLAGNPYRYENYRTGHTNQVNPTVLLQMVCAALNVSIEVLMTMPIETIFRDSNIDKDVVPDQP